VMNTPEAAERVQREFPELRSRLVVSISNGFDEADFAEPAPTHADDKFRIVHAGYLHTEHGLRLRKIGWTRKLLGGRYAAVDTLPRSHYYLVEALAQLAEEDPSVRDTIEVVLAGVVNDTDREIAERSAVPIVFPGYVSHAQTVRLLRAGDLLFLPMHDLPEGVRAGLVPGKTYEYLAARRPILAAVPDGDARELLLDTGNAFVCRPGDVAAMARILRDRVASWRADEPPPAPREDVLARYERRHLTRELASVFDTVLGGTSAPASPAQTADAVGVEDASSG
jgi:glycosyltransferase involved in cell wall biosynthesis